MLAIGAVTVAAAFCLGFSALAMVRIPQIQPAVADLVGADGSAVLLTDPDRPDTTLAVETAHQFGVSVLGTGAVPLQRLVQLPDLETTQFVRIQRTVLAVGAPTSVQYVHRLSSDGLELLAIHDTADGTRYFEPALRVLPAAPRPGEVWDGSGDQLDSTGTSIGRWVWQSRVVEEVDGCLVVESSLTLGTDRPRQERTTWCRDRGISAVRTPARQWYRSLARLPVEGVAVPELGPLDGALVATRLTRRVEGVDLLTQTRVDPVTTGDLLVVAPDTGADLIALRRADGRRTEVAWVAHPGGIVTAMRTVGTSVVVATSQRRLVGYDADGIRRWTADLPDVVTEPIDVVDGDLLVVDDSGAIQRISAATGLTRWRSTVDADVRDIARGCSVAGVAALAVADSSPAVTLVAEHDGAILRVVDLPDTAQAVACHGPSLMVGDDQATLSGWNLNSGRRNWQQVRVDGIDDLVGSVDRVLVVDDGEVAALDPSTGRPLWSWRGGSGHLLTTAGQLVISDPEGVSILSADGFQARVEADLGSVPGDHRMARGPDALWIVASDGALWQVAR